MAKKLALTAALLMGLLALAAANTYTTTVTTTTIDDDEANQGQQQQCQQQLQGRQFRSCQRYLSQGRRRYNSDDFDEEFLALRSDNRGEKEEQGQEQSLRQCCQQLREVNEQCRCEAIKQAMRQQQQEYDGARGGVQGEQGQEMYEKARELPRRCNMQPQQCQFRAIIV